ncbi:MAG: MoxR family ATPase [Cytophagales bacterium]|nr:MoxR family ATPase [Cytophagales bacterium]
MEALASEVNELVDKLGQLKTEIHKVIVGQDQVIDELLIGLLAKGHVLIEGMPGLAKTLLIKTLSEVVDLSYKRIQFTPDLMPTDILGTEVIEEEGGHKTFVYKQGPIFANMVLADEINRTPPKTQAALLEVMQEYKVTYGGKDYHMDLPFFLLATQNPIEQSGTFPLPEAQTDRFLLFIKIGYPTEEEETEVLNRTTGKVTEKPNPVLNAKEVIRLQELVREVTIDEELISAVSKLVRRSRPDMSSDDYIKNHVAYGAGPRAGQAIILCAKANALLAGRYAVIPEDLRKVAYPALRHRIALNFRAESDGLTTDQLIDHLLKDFKY